VAFYLNSLTIENIQESSWSMPDQWAVAIERERQKQAANQPQAVAQDKSRYSEGSSTSNTLTAAERREIGGGSSGSGSGSSSSSGSGLGLLRVTSFLQFKRGSWEAYADKDNNLFYYNTLTGETRYCIYRIVLY